MSRSEPATFGVGVLEWNYTYKFNNTYIPKLHTNPIKLSNMQLKHGIIALWKLEENNEFNYKKQAVQFWN